MGKILLANNARSTRRGRNSNHGVSSMPRGEQQSGSTHCVYTTVHGNAGSRSGETQSEEADSHRFTSANTREEA